MKILLKCFNRNDYNCVPFGGILTKMTVAAEKHNRNHNHHHTTNGNNHNPKRKESWDSKNSDEQ
uniref:Uncharacterized protein n=1 Tax=Lutzomyia longipalpis TaxID=7200 RepID=A0A1B0CII6_LUTLO